MSTRTRQRQATGDQAIDDVAPVDLEASADRLERLPELVQSMGSTPPFERLALATQINDLLIAMRAPGHETEESELVLELLTTRVLNDQLDERGRSCRKEAVETLMACGFPHALLLDPDDLRFAREFRQTQASGDTPDELAAWEQSMRTDRRTGGAVMVAAQVLAAVLAFPGMTSVPLIAVSGVLFTAGVLAGLLLAVRRPRDLNIATFGAFATLLVVAGLAIAAFTANGFAALGAAGVGAGLVVSIARLFEERADPPKPGDWNYSPDRDLTTRSGLFDD